MKKVIATKPGFYGSLRNPGDEFEVTDETPLGTWLKRADGGEDLFDDVRSMRASDPVPAVNETRGNPGPGGEVLDVHGVKKGAKGSK